MKTADILKETSLKTLQGSCLRIDTRRKAVQVEGVGLSETDIMADNGVIHVLESLISPEMTLPCES
jgi:uncharacterized surface protein with fasciclin (FAS1) repeats